LEQDVIAKAVRKTIEYLIIFFPNKNITCSNEICIIHQIKFNYIKKRAAKAAL
tara:strand:- start:123 stop:281 length:159 start_codon:yes stop_codon:yes gene_type:complete